jgi:hypothetical protein
MLTGGCFCGAIRYATDGVPFDCSRLPWVAPDGLPDHPQTADGALTAAEGLSAAPRLCHTSVGGQPVADGR